MKIFSPANCLRFLILILCGYGPVAAQSSAADQRPNIILIVADDHGREAVGCYGNRVVRTPAIDRLASEGTRFTHAFATVASCSPSRSVILTGMYSHANGMYGLQHAQHHFQSFDTIKSLPRLLQEAGYRTGRIGKFHVAPEAVFPFQSVLQAGMVNNPRSIGRSTVQMADLCRSFISDSSGQPFFLLFGTDDPHRSNTVLPDGMPFFDATRPNPFGNIAGGYPQVNEVVYQPEEVVVPPYLPDTRATRLELAGYYQAISRLDQGVGRLLDHLRASGKYENTLIIYLSDNGAPFPASKTTLYEPGIRLPLIVKLPGQQPGGRIQDAMVSWADITPTLLDLAGALPTQSSFQGRSFKNIMGRQQVSGWDEVYGAHVLHEVTMYYPMRMLRERRFKLIYNIAHELTFPMALDLHQSFTWQNLEKNKLGRRSVGSYLHRPEFELYDLQNDPDEIQNLAADPEYKKELERMKEKLKRFQQSTGDMWYHKWEFE